MGSSDGPILNASGVSRIFGSGDTAVTALSAINLIVQEGDFLAVTGRSGSGKTTLLNLLSGLDRPTTGSVHFHGRDISRFGDQEMVEIRRHKIGFVFNHLGLYHSCLLRKTWNYRSILVVCHGGNGGKG